MIFNRNHGEGSWIQLISIFEKIAVAFNSARVHRIPISCQVDSSLMSIMKNFFLANASLFINSVAKQSSFHVIKVFHLIHSMHYYALSFFRLYGPDSDNFHYPTKELT